MIIMEFAFEDKTILIISPQSWGKLYTSKQHYALELSRLGNIVYFLNPPTRKIGLEFQIEKNIAQNIFIINYQLPFPYILRFHFPDLYDILFQMTLRSIKNKINEKFDLVWCFDNNLSYDLNIFDAEIKLFHIVDNLASSNTPKTAFTADIILGVSDYLLENTKTLNKPKYFINHGLSNYFVSQAKRNLEFKTYKKNENEIIRFGYVGNLFLSSIDRTTFLEIIHSNPDVEFHFWGPKDEFGSASSSENKLFINLLMREGNTHFHGIVSPEELANNIFFMDGFIVCLDRNKDINKGSNSHKILEYLSTGKIVLSNYISTYADKDLLVMSSNDENDDMPNLFNKIKNNLNFYNSAELREKRIEFALDNTYEKQIQRIQKIIKNLIFNES